MGRRNLLLAVCFLGLVVLSETAADNASVDEDVITLSIDDKSVVNISLKDRPITTDSTVSGLSDTILVQTSESLNSIPNNTEKTEKEGGREPIAGLENDVLETSETEVTEIETNTEEQTPVMLSPKNKSELSTPNAANQTELTTAEVDVTSENGFTMDRLSENIETTSTTEESSALNETETTVTSNASEDLTKEKTNNGTTSATDEVELTTASLKPQSKLHVEESSAKEKIELTTETPKNKNETKPTTEISKAKSQAESASDQPAPGNQTELITDNSSETNKVNITDKSNTTLSATQPASAKPIEKSKATSETSISTENLVIEETDSTQSIPKTEHRSTTFLSSESMKSSENNRHSESATPKSDNKTSNEVTSRYANSSQKSSLGSTEVAIKSMTIVSAAQTTTVPVTEYDNILVSGDLTEQVDNQTQLDNRSSVRMKRVDFNETTSDTTPQAFTVNSTTSTLTIKNSLDIMTNEYIKQLNRTVDSVAVELRFLIATTMKQIRRHFRQYHHYLVIVSQRLQQTMEKLVDNTQSSIQRSKKYDNVRILSSSSTKSARGNETRGNKDGKSEETVKKKVHLSEEKKLNTSS
ncbi:hypothetical protein ACOME3_008329 [Neoechinorhynchus agilis]